MNGRTPIASSRLAIAVGAALFVFAFVAAPNSCDWGLEAYFWAGVLSVGLVFAAPFSVRFRPPVRSAGLQAVGCAALVAGFWIAGLFVANVRILCRLF